MVKFLCFFIFQGLSSQPPRDLNSLLVEIRVPEDMDNSPWAQQFSKHLATLQQPEKEAMLDFVVVVNVLRNKETEVKQVSKGMKWRLSDLNKERRELLKMIMESFFSPNCDTPIALRNQVLRQNLKKIFQFFTLKLIPFF